MSRYEEFVAAVERATGRQGRRVGRNVRLLCPAHDDRNPSLDVAEGDDGGPLVVCRAGCSFEAICEAIGWAPRRDPNPRWTPDGDAVAVYDYVDESGRLLFQVRRTAGKKFFQCRPDPTSKSGWRFNLDGVRRVLYRLPEAIEAAAQGGAVYVCEGEKDAEAVRATGAIATCNPGGAGKWREEYTAALAGANVVVVADRDEAGYRHAQHVAAALGGVAASVTLVEPAEGKDVSDHLAAGLTLVGLVELRVEVREPEGERSPSRAAQILDLASGAELFHTELFKAYATVPVGDHRETWPVRSRRFKVWLSHCFYHRDGVVPSAAARNDALTVIEGIALHDGPMCEVSVRVARVDNTIYLDLADPEWRVVEIDEDGWRIAPSSPVRFVRSHGMLSLPLPQPGGSIELLRPYVNLDGDEFVLFVSWLVACFRPTGPFPVVDLLGEQGSAKSTTARIARELVDPNRAALRTAPRDLRDFVVTTTSSWIAAFDNLSSIPEWLSDALCRLSTGGGFATRELYTDADEVIFDAQRPALLTGIVELATRSDLLDRSLLITLPNIRDAQRLPEDIFWERFQRDRPLILGALLDAVACALRRQPSVRVETLPRMADFAVWAVAAAPALGWTPERFLTAYEENRGSVHLIAIDDNPAGAALLEVGRAGFQGTATELLKALSAKAGEQTVKERGWPKTARALSTVIRRLQPNLRALGVEVLFERETTGEKRRIVWLIPKTTRPPVTSVTPVTTHDPPRADGDETGDGDAPPPVTEPARADGADRPGDAGDAGDGPCRYASHRKAGCDWVNDAGNLVCGVCRPRPGAEA